MDLLESRVDCGETNKTQDKPHGETNKTQNKSTKNNKITRGFVDIYGVEAYTEI